MPNIARRQILKTLSLTGIGTAVFQRALADEAVKRPALSLDQITNAEWIAGIQLTDEQRAGLLNRLTQSREEWEKIRAVPLQYDSLPSLRFDPEMGDPGIRIRAMQKPECLQENAEPVAASPADPSSVDPNSIDPSSVVASSPDLSFLTIRELGRRLRAGQLTSVELTGHCLEQLKSRDAVLTCVVNLTEDLAMRQAQRADLELASGHDRGPLHGIPWGAKDLIGVSGYPTTWGAPQFRDQQMKGTATVAHRLEEAGAVLVAKLSLGAVAMGDLWFRGQTKNPWNPAEGSSGSSAGSASAVAAGLVPFAIGSETLGSIISPSRRCGVTGLRPTFGRVSRAGCMALSWTMDKIGPITRSADDCGFVFAAIHGRDDADPTTVDRWFQWPMGLDFSRLKIGRVRNCETAAPEQAALDLLKDLGGTVVDVELPREFPEWSVSNMLEIEAACVFQELTRTGNTEGLNSWPDIFKAAHFVSAVDYLQASRIRLELMKKMAAVFDKVALYVGGEDLGIANVTGHPCLALPVMMSGEAEKRRPDCCTLTGGLYAEATLLALAQVLEQKADVLKYHPPS